MTCGLMEVVIRVSVDITEGKGRCRVTLSRAKVTAVHLLIVTIFVEGTGRGLEVSRATFIFSA